MSNFVTPTSHKKRKIALILCIFLGLFGFHRFYVGKIGTGIIYFFTAGLFCIGWLIWSVFSWGNSKTVTICH